MRAGCRLLALALTVATVLARPSASAQPVVDRIPADTGGADAVTTSAPKGASAAGAISNTELRAAAAAMDEGRTALKHDNLGSAIQLFVKVLKYPENQYSAEAQELLGVA